MENRKTLSGLSTDVKFAIYDAANAAGGGEASHNIWETFTPSEKDLWRKQSGAVLAVTGVQKPQVKKKS